MEAIRSTDLYNNLIIVFSHHPPGNQPATISPDGSLAPPTSWPSVAQL
jgi:hypothetical protein